MVRKIDKRAEDCKVELRKEILTDLESAKHFTVSVTYDGGTSNDKHKTKKLAITLHRQGWQKVRKCGERSSGDHLEK